MATHHAQVRLLVAGDIDAVRDIDAEVYGRPWSKQLFVDHLENPDWFHVVAVDASDSHVLGHAALLTVAPEGCVATVAVDPRCQRAGLGSRLMLALIDHAFDRDLNAISLEVRASNEAAVLLYRKFGFAPAGVRPAYYPAVGHLEAEDALIMWAHDIDGHDYRQRIADLGQRVSAGGQRVSAGGQRVSASGEVCDG